MSYPPDVYRGETGEATGTVRPADSASELRFENGGSCDYLATGASTGGGFGLYRWNMAPGAGGPGPHFHKSITESFYVLSGAMRLYDGKQWSDAGPDDFFFVREGGIHGFSNDSDEPASMLILFTPGAPREDYFETLASLARGSTMTEEERAAFMIRHDTYWVQ
jgi:quercetin dioxygenase-like cupin family protein